MENELLKTLQSIDGSLKRIADNIENNSNGVNTDEVIKIITDNIRNACSKAYSSNIR